MKKLRTRFNRFCFTHRNAGIPNLMLWIIIAQAVFYFIYMSDPSGYLYMQLVFIRSAILNGQVWRIFTFILLDFVGQNPLAVLLFAFCYYQISRLLENVWGTLRFNLYYFTGLFFLIIAGFIFDIPVSAQSLSLSLLLAYATLFPDQQFYLFFVIPVKARWLGLFYLGIAAFNIADFRYFPFNLIYLFTIANYFLHFGKDFLNIFPQSWRLNARKLGRKNKGTQKAKTIPIHQRSSGTTTSYGAPSYRHRCTVCGRTDTANPDLEFRYCSKCAGYHCYCMDHINNHSHITE